jgi:aryl-alcohol dehydrogenase-like predicted oxidoreductase
MKFAQLGGTGLYVSRIALGTMTFGGGDTMPWSIIGGLDQPAAETLVHTALDAGVNLIDTADMYAGGESEEILGRIIKAAGTRWCWRPSSRPGWDPVPTTWGCPATT